jgi:phosphoribosylamine--glycine ligase
MYDTSIFEYSPSGCAYLLLAQLCAQNKNFDVNFLHRIIDLASTQSSDIERTKSVYYKHLTGIDIPPYQTYTSFAELAKLVAIPCVVKMDAFRNGLQTQVIKSNKDFKSLYEILDKNDTSGVVQQFVTGQELTVMVLVGTYNWQLVGTARDYKQEFDGNHGRNTFGMGSIAPAGMSADALDLVNKIVNIFKEQYNYVGFLSCQFIIDSDNKIWFLECNSRLCDPEFQSVIPSLNSGIYDSIKQALDGEVIAPISNSNTNAVTVALVHQDWPDAEGKPSIAIPDSDFTFCKFPGKKDANTYYGSLTNSGSESHKELAQELYAFLSTIDTAPYRYRTDIGIDT